MRNYTEKSWFHHLEYMVEPIVHKIPNSCTHLEKETVGENKNSAGGPDSSPETYVHLCPRANLKSSQLRSSPSLLGSWVGQTCSLCNTPHLQPQTEFGVSPHCFFGADLPLLLFLLVLLLWFIDEFLGRCCSIKRGRPVTSKGILKSSHLLLLTEAIFPKGKKGKQASLGVITFLFLLKL